ncbi:MAG: hypothetical protein J6A69_01450 [Clostridia bacterium]|nr:hypothetical protein [Clostridia bacterium]
MVKKSFHITDLIFELGNVSAGISGKAVIEAGNNETYPCKWADISLYNSDGILIDTKKSDADGSFVFDNLNPGEYFIIGQTSEIRFDSDHGYDRPYNLTGNAYVFVEHPDTYEIGTIILHESTQSRTNISGKVTAHGEPQNCNVVLTDASGREIDSQRVGNNGKYTFKKLNDGLYFITATTDSNGSGFCVITIINGKAYGTLNITVHKEQRFADREEKWKSDIGDCTNKEKALLIKGRIREEKEFYDSLSHKEKKQFSKEYTETLNKFVEWTADVGYIVNDENVEVENGGFAVSGEEIENETKVDFVLDIQKSDAYQKSETGIKNSDDYIQHSIEEMAGDRNLIQYYDITLTKKADGKEYRIESIAKNTDTTGKVRITVTIPEEYKGYDKYSFIHVHKGEVTELTDLDDNPDTVTFEVDKFSTFVLSGSNEEVVSPSGKITYENGEITVTADKDSILYIKTLNPDGTSSVTTIKNITAGSSEKLAFTEYDSAFLWDENMQPLCHKFTISQSFFRE